jgi:hypothetical protein
LTKNTAQQLVADIDSGIPDADLMAKYRLQPEVFYRYKAAVKDSLAQKNTASERSKLSLDAHQILDDLRAHMDDQSLMMKHNLTQRQLQGVFRQLIHEGLIAPLEIANRLKVTKSQVTEAFVEMGKDIGRKD